MIQQNLQMEPDFSSPDMREVSGQQLVRSRQVNAGSTDRRLGGTDGQTPWLVLTWKRS